MNKITIGIILGIVVLGGLIWIAQPNGKNANTSVAPAGVGVLIAQASTFDFGTISMAAGNVTHMFTLQNTGTDAVTIKKIYTSCMCTSAALMMSSRTFGPYGMPGHMAIPAINQTLKPQEEATVAVVFDPAAHGPAGVGTIARVITIENSAGAPVELKFTATVTP